MGAIAEKTAQKFTLSREKQEDFAIQSAQKALKGYEEGFFQGELVQGLSISIDEPLSRVNFDKFRTLSPAFEGTITAATASAMADGAAFTLSCPLSVAEKYHMKPLALIRGFATCSKNPDEFIEAPAFAIQKLLDQLNWSLKDVDVFEINEAFSIVPLVTLQCLTIDRERMNMYGGACALGHPLGTTGIRLIGTLARIMNKHNLARGIAALCIGGGEGIAIALQNPSYL